MCVDLLRTRTKDLFQALDNFARVFAIRPGEHPIVPIMLGEARLAVDFARKLLDQGIYVIGFSYPVVPQGKARIRVQLSAAHSSDDIDRAIAAFSTGTSSSRQPAAMTKPPVPAATADKLTAAVPLCPNTT